MKVSQLCEAMELELISAPDYEDREVEGCYIGDLLSWVMGRANPDDMWITIMSNINIAAVASLADVACVVLAEGVEPDAGVLDKMNMQNIIVFKSQKTAYELAAAYYRATI